MQVHVNWLVIFLACFHMVRMLVLLLVLHPRVGGYRAIITALPFLDLTEMNLRVRKPKIKFTASFCKYT